MLLASHAEAAAEGDAEDVQRGPAPVGSTADGLAQTGQAHAHPTAMALMGWSSAAMAKRYQHLIDTIRRDVARQVGGLLWDADDASPEHVARANETRPDAEPGR